MHGEPCSLTTQMAMIGTDVVSTTKGFFVFRFLLARLLLLPLGGLASPPLSPAAAPPQVHGLSLSPPSLLHADLRGVETKTEEEQDDSTSTSRRRGQETHFLPMPAGLSRAAEAADGSDSRAVERRPWRGRLPLQSPLTPTSSSSSRCN